MNPFSRVMVVLVLLLSAAFAASQMVLYAKREKYQQRYQDALAKLQTTSGRASDLEKERDDSRRYLDGIKLEKEARIDDLEATVDGLERQIRDLQATLSKKDDDLSGARTQIDKLVVTLQEQVKYIDGVEKANWDLKENLRVAAEEIKGLEDKVLATAKNVQVLQSNVVDLEKAKQDVVKERDYWVSIVSRYKEAGLHVEPEVVPVVDGKVVGVLPELGAVVIDKGSEDKVQVAFPFTIYRGSEFVAKVTVIEVYDNLCLARAAEGLFDKEKPMAVGDNATTRMY